MIFTADLTNIQSFTCYQKVLKETDLVSKQMIIFFTKCDEFEEKIKNPKFFEKMCQSFPNYKENDSKKFASFIKEEYLKLTKDSIRKKAFSFDFNLLDQNKMKTALETIFNLK